MKKLISKLLIGSMCICSLNGLVYASGSDVNFFLEKIATTTNKEKRDQGIFMVEKSVINGELKVDILKPLIRAGLSAEDEKKLQDKGYTKESAIKNLDVLKNINSEDTKKLIDALKSQDQDTMKSIVSKYENSTSNQGSGSSTNSGSNTSSVQSPNVSTSTTNVKQPVNDIKNIESKAIFKDLNNHWAKSDIEFLVSKGIIKGQSEDMFNPDGKITRAEFTQIIVRLLDLKEKENVTVAFKDLNSNEWYYNAVKIGKQNGIINGIDNDNFAPNKEVTREEMISIIIRAIQNKTLKSVKENDITINKFKDKDNTSNWAVENINKGLKLNIIKGKDEALFDSKGIATRAEAASMIKRVFNLIN